MHHHATPLCVCTVTDEYCWLDLGARRSAAQARAVLFIARSVYLSRRAGAFELGAAWRAGRRPGSRSSSRLLVIPRRRRRVVVEVDRRHPTQLVQLLDLLLLLLHLQPASCAIIQCRINANPRGLWQLFPRGPLITRDKDLSKLYIIHACNAWAHRTRMIISIIQR